MATNKVGVRTSKFRHLFGTAAQAAETFCGVQLGACAPDSNFLSANDHFVALPWVLSGTIGIVRHDAQAKRGAIDAETFPLINVQENVNDFELSPHRAGLLAVASSKSDVELYSFSSSPDDGGLKEHMQSPTTTLSSHTKRTLFAHWHPHAASLLLSHAADYEMKVFDAQAERCALTLPRDEKKQKSIITSTAWSPDGSRVAYLAKDKQLRIADPRAPDYSSVVSVPDHQGAKTGRVLWPCDHPEHLATIGFTRDSAKDVALWDVRRMDGAESKAVCRQRVDQSTSTPMVFYDDDLGVMYSAGKGDSTIRTFELDPAAGAVHALSEFKSKDAQNGMCALSKGAALNVIGCEVFKLLKLTTSAIVPIRFEVPRSQTGIFHDDLFPPTASFSPRAPALAAEEWLGGKNEMSERKSLKPKE